MDGQRCETLTRRPLHIGCRARGLWRGYLLAVLPPDEGDRLVASCLAIYSAPFWQMLRDRGQLSADGAREAGVAAMDAVLGAARARAARITHP